MKYFQPILSAVSLIFLAGLTFHLQQLKAPDKETTYYLGFVIVAVAAPLLGALLAAFVKKTTTPDGVFEWSLFHWFVIGFAALSIFSRIAEIRALEGQ
ncbi:MAG: hypothetical protein SFV52_13295 [Saprospiraceae bacterium]|nr:hypothetical protein [Saprospiraceae bacterium]